MALTCSAIYNQVAAEYLPDKLLPSIYQTTRHVTRVSKALILWFLHAFQHTYMYYYINQTIIILIKRFRK